jgi:hypothetical protein
MVRHPVVMHKQTYVQTERQSHQYLQTSFIVHNVQHVSDFYKTIVRHTHKNLRENSLYKKLNKMELKINLLDS